MRQLLAVRSFSSGSGCRIRGSCRARGGCGGVGGWRRSIRCRGFGAVAPGRCGCVFQQPGGQLLGVGNRLQGRSLRGSGRQRQPFGLRHSNAAFSCCWRIQQPFKIVGSAQCRCRRQRLRGGRVGLHPGGQPAGRRAKQHWRLCCAAKKCGCQPFAVGHRQLRGAGGRGPHTALESRNRATLPVL